MDIIYFIFFVHKGERFEEKQAEIRIAAIYYSNNQA